jgi:hypothetical protein
MTTWHFGTPRMFGYEVIVADPPWDFRELFRGGRHGAGEHQGPARWRAGAATRFVVDVGDTKA